MELQTIERPQVQVNQKEISEYLDAFGLTSQLDPKEKNQFIQVATAYQLNPFKREIYCIPYGEGDKRKLSIITGFEVYLKRAERSGKLDGWKVWTEGQAQPVQKQVERTGRNGKYTKTVTAWQGNLKACIEIYRKDRGRAFGHEVYLSEYAQENEMWAGKPITMLKKVVMAQGFRLCFPDELGGIPYTADELPDEMTNLKVAEPTRAPEVPQESPAPETVHGTIEGKMPEFTLPEFSGDPEVIVNQPGPAKSPLPKPEEKPSPSPEAKRSMTLVLQIGELIKEWPEEEQDVIRVRVKEIGKNPTVLEDLKVEIMDRNSKAQTPVPDLGGFFG